MPAIQRYDGPVYRCLRKYRETARGFPIHLHILIVSAKYGLILPQTQIPDYDVRMTPGAARIHQYTVQKLLDRCLQYHSHLNSPFNEVFIHLGKTYKQTLEGFDWGHIRTLEAAGGIGERVSQMKAWLERIKACETIRKQI